MFLRLKGIKAACCGVSFESHILRGPHIFLMTCFAPINLSYVNLTIRLAEELRGVGGNVLPDREQGQGGTEPQAVVLRRASKLGKARQTP